MLHAGLPACVARRLQHACSLFSRPGCRAACVSLTLLSLPLQADMDLDALLQFCVGLSGRLDLSHLLASAAKLHEHAGAAGARALASAGLAQ